MNARLLLCLKLAAAAVAVGSIGLFGMGNAFFYTGDFPWLRSWSYNVLQFGVPFTLWVYWAERATANAKPAVAMALMALGVLVVSACGVWVFGPLLFPILGGDPSWGRANDVMLSFQILLTLSMLGFAYLQWRFNQRSAQNLLSAQADAAAAAQQAQAKRLLALQAQIEPGFLHQQLMRMRQRMDGDGGADVAHQQLSRLIALLRLMQPHAQASTSSLQRELDLVAAHAAAAEVPQLQAPLFEPQVLPEHLAAPLAPLVLPTTLRQLVQAAPTVRWQLNAQTVKQLVVAQIESQPEHRSAAQAALASVPVEALRERLQSVHGSNADVRLTEHTLQLHWPLPPPLVAETPA